MVAPRKEPFLTRYGCPPKEFALSLLGDNLMAWHGGFAILDWRNRYRQEELAQAVLITGDEGGACIVFQVTATACQ